MSRALRRLAEVSLYAWTVDEPERMCQLVEMAVDGITSNRPDLLAALAPAEEIPPARPTR